MIVTEIERSAIHDGPGIRTVVFVSGCPLRCYWCCNPETQSGRPVLLHDDRLCVGCGACAKVCLQHAVRMEEGKPVIDRTRCIGCGQCAAVCPTGADTISGKEMTLSEILTEVRRDAAYYAATGGGMTLSGGEPLLQKGAPKLLQRVKAEGYSTAVETTACVPWESIEQAIAFTDHFHIDYKHANAVLLKEHTGGQLPLIEENIKKLCQRGAHVTLRTPVIPGFNADEVTLARCFQFAVSCGLTEYVLLPYHALGRGKYQKLDQHYAPGELRTLTAEDLAPYAALGTRIGLAVRIGG